MKTPEEIMEAFKCCERDVLDPCSGCPYEREYAEDWKCALNNDALACIQQLEAQVPKWVSVNDILPENDTPVICWYLSGDGKYYHSIGTYHQYKYGGLWRVEAEDDGCGYGCKEVTHWMPLPEPPKETTT